MLGNTTGVQTYNSGGGPNASATYSAVFNAVKQRLGFNDSDLGSCSNVPLPAGCSSSTALAWNFTYDADGNQLSSTDPRNQSLYSSYDNLDRPLCRGATPAQVNPCQSSAYAQFFYDNYNNTSNPSVTFPSGCVAPSGSYASDPVGHTTAELFSNSAGSGWRCYGYDQRGQQDQGTLSVTADGQTTTQTMNMLYNDGGEVTGLVYPDQETVTSQYDGNGRFQSAYFGTPASADPVSFLVGQASYTDWGQLSGMTIGGSGPKGSGPTTPVFSAAFTYDGIQRPSSSSATENSQSFWSQGRTYDNVGNVLGLSTTVPTQSGGSLTQNEAFCYDALSRLVWAGNTGTPSGGDHCMTAPSGTSLPTYQQAYSYDSLDRLTGGETGAVSYSDPNHVHAAMALGSLPNPYAAYDAMGNMTCRNTDTTTAHTCGSTPTGARMTYDVEGRMDSWTAPSGTTATDQFLYDNSGNRVLQRTTTGSTISDTITFDGYTETTISGSTTTTTKYYSENGQRIALKVGNALSYLLSDSLSSSTVALTSTGSAKAVQLYSPYGSVRYSSGTMPTTYNFTGQRLDSQTGLLYYNFRYYDPVGGRFVRADTVQNNAGGTDPYAYVGGNPETINDPTGQYVAYYGGGGYVPSPSPNADSNNSWWGSVGNFFHTAFNVSNQLGNMYNQANLKVIDFLTGYSSMWSDVQTLFNGKASLSDKGWAAGDLVLNAGMDVLMFTGIGEVVRGADVGVRITDDVFTGVKDVLSHACSFTARTLVATAHGKLPIGTLHVGDKVWAYNPQTHKMEMQPILHVWVHTDNDLIDLTIATPPKGHHGASSKSKSEVVHTNQKHPFLTTEYGFVPVGQIKVGMHVVRADGSIGVITRWTIVPGVKMMYNLEVAQDHTFTVGDGQWVVHNCGMPSIPSGVRSLIHNDPGLVREATRMGNNQIVQREADDLIQRFLEGNTNPGLGSKNLFGNISYLRGRNGARVFYRFVDDTMEILGKADKNNEQKVISILMQLYGP